MGPLASAIARGLSRALTASPKLVSDLSKRFGLTGGLNSVRSFANRHPISSFIGMSAAYTLGEDAIVGMFDEELAKEGASAQSLIEAYSSDPEVQPVLEELLMARENYLHASGDGSSDTVSGVPVSEWKASAILIKEATDRIDRLVGVLGSLRAVEELFYGLKFIEPEHLEVYRLQNS